MIAVPAWTRELDGLIRRAVRAAPLLAHATPINFADEVARLEGSAVAGAPLVPAFVYRDPPRDGPALCAALTQAVDALPRHEPLARIYAARALQAAGDLVWARELTEASGADGTQRFAPRGDGFDEAADRLCTEWLEEAREAVGEAAAERADRAAGAAAEEAFEVRHGGDVVTDDERDPRSLVSRLRQVIGERRLGARVVVVRGMAPLAAVGDGVVQVAAGRRLSVEDVERTVAHEVDGHLVPACAAAAHRLGIFVLGTVHGSDDQEGRALLVERRRGHLLILRRRTLALRHVAARLAQRGDAFHAVVEALRERGGFTRESVRIAARAVRGRGLGREAVYVPAMLRVEAAVGADPGLERVLAAGRVGVDDAPDLAPWV